MLTKILFSIAIPVASSLVLGISFGASQVNAASIAIANAGFEEPNLAEVPPVVGEEVFTFETPPGWELYDPSNLVPDNGNLSTSFVGVWDPSSAFYTNEAPEGNNIGSILLAQPPGSGEVAFSQLLSSTLTANAQYTLQVDVGNPGSPLFAGFPGYRIELLAGGTVIAEDDNTLTLGEGTFDTSVISFIASADNPNLGEPLEIRLFHPLTSSGLEVNFDDVRLDVTPVPEAASVVGLLALGTWAASSVLKRQLSK